MGAHTFRYSYAWAQDVVQKLVESHARGTENLAKILGIEEKEISLRLILLIRRENQIKYRAMKRLLKYLDRDNWREYASIPLHERRVYIKMCLWNAEDEEFSRLEALDKARQSRLDF